MSDQFELPARMGSVGEPSIDPSILQRVASYTSTASQAAKENPILAPGQIGYETDTLSFKIGDGKTNYNSLTYFYRGLPVAGEPSLGTPRFIASPTNAQLINGQVIAAGPTWYTATFTGIPTGTKAVVTMCSCFMTGGPAMYFRPYGSGLGINIARKIVLAGAASSNIGGQCLVPVDSSGRCEFTAEVGATIYVANAVAYYI